MKAKRLLSILLCVLMLVSLFPASAMAADGDPCTVDLYLDPGQDAGTVSVNPASGWRVGQTVTLTAVAKSGYTFMWWVNYATGETSKDSVYTTTLTGDCEWDAVFRKNGEYFIYINKPWVENSPSQTLQVSPSKAAYGPGDTITLTAPAKAGHSVVYEYGRDVDGHASSVTSWTRLSGNTFTMPSYDVWVRGLYSYNITVNAGEHGTVTLSPASGPYYEEDTVTMTITPDDGYRIAQYDYPEGSVITGDSITGRTVRFPMPSEDLELGVTFTEREGLNLQVICYPTSGGTVQASQNGNALTVTATSAANYTFAYWMDQNTKQPLSVDNPYTFTPTQNMTLVACFAIPYPAEGGTITSALGANGTVTMTASPAQGYSFTSWLNLADSSQNLGSDPVLSFAPSSGIVPAAYFELGSLRVYLYGNGTTEHGSFSVKNVQTLFSEGQTVELQASPEEGYVLESFYIAQNVQGASFTPISGTSFTMPNYDVIVAARFVRGYSISAAVSPAEGGAVTGAGEYGEGETVTLTATANAGYAFVNWTENGTEVSTDASYSFTAAADRTLTANFLRADNIVVTADTSALSALKPGDSFRVPVRVTANTGFAGAQIKLSYDSSRLTLDSLELGEFADPASPGQQSVGTKYLRIGGVTTETGVLFYANFTVKSDAASGTAEIGFEEALLSDVSGNAITGSFTPGAVTVENPADTPLYGDADCDGQVDLVDAFAVGLHLSDNDPYSLSPQGRINADVDDKDGVTGRDILAIENYLVGAVDSLRGTQPPRPTGGKAGSDLVFAFRDADGRDSVTVQPGDTVTVKVLLTGGTAEKLAGLDLRFKATGGLSVTQGQFNVDMMYVEGDNVVLSSGAVRVNGSAAVGMTIARSKPMLIDRDYQPMFTLTLSVPADTPAGVYTLGFDDGNCRFYPDCSKALYGVGFSPLSIEVVVPVTAYPLWVGGVQVTSANRGNILGDGTAKYEGDATGGTLTLTNANITGYALEDGDECGQSANILIGNYDDTMNVTVQLEGTNTLSGASNGIDGWGCAMLSLTGSGTLNASGQVCGVSSDSAMEINGPAVVAEATGNVYGFGIWAYALTIRGGSTVTASGDGLGVVCTRDKLTVAENSALTAEGGDYALSVRNEITLDGVAIRETEPAGGAVGSYKDGNKTAYSVLVDGEKVKKVVIGPLLITAYPLWVGGVQVTSANLSGDCDGGGTWSYVGDATGGTLTLTNATITATHTDSGGVTANIYAGDYEERSNNGTAFALTLSLAGTSTLSGTKHGVVVYGSLTVEGGGSGALKVTAGKNALFAWDALALSACTVEAGGASALDSGYESITITDSTVTAAGTTDAISASFGNVTITDSTVSGSSTGDWRGINTHTLSISGDSAVTAESANDNALYVKTITLGDGIAVTEPAGGVVKQNEYGRDNVFPSADSDTPVKKVTFAKPVTAYPLWVGGVQVTSANLSGNCDGGTWSYEGNASGGTLTLTNANITGTYAYNSSNNANIFARNLDLTISLSGTSSLSGAKRAVWTYPGDLTITGGGSLTASSAIYAGYGLCVDGNLTVTGGSTVTASCSSSTGGYGILASDAVTIEDGSTVTATGFYGGIWAAAVSITIENSTVTATSTGTNSSGLRSKGITITDSTVTAAGGEYGIDAINAGGTLTISGENSVVTAEGGTQAIYAPAGVTLNNNGLDYIEGSADAKKAVIAKPYTITVENAANGAVTADKTLTGAGITVTLTINPATGYALDALTVKQGDADVSTTKVDDTTYTFTMPAGAVTVSATFKGLPLTGTVTVSGTPTYGETLTAAYTSGNNTGELAYQWLRGDTAIDGATGTSYTLTGDDVGQTLACRVSSSVQTGTLASDPTAAAARAALTVSAEAKTKTFGETDPILTYTADGLVGSDAITGELTREAGEDVGAYAITQGTLTAGDNYTIAFTGAELTITPATGAADETKGETPEPKTDLAYSGEPQALVTPPEQLPDGYGEVQYSINDGASWSSEPPVASEPGDYSVRVKYVGDANHADFESAPVAVTIKPVRTVTFNMDGAEPVEDLVVVDGKLAAKPADPARNGYKFDGWYADAEFKTAFDFDAPITEDTTIYAKWTAIGYSLTKVTGATADASHTWQKGSTAPAVFTFKPVEGEDHSFALFVGVKLDGVALALGVDFTAAEGSTIVTLKPATLEKLSAGTHTVSVLFQNGTVDVRLTVKAASKSGIPATGDARFTGLWTTLMALSGLGLGVVTLPGKKRRKGRGTSGIPM